MRIYIDMDRVMFDYDTGYGLMAARHPHVRFVQSLPGFFAGLDPLPGAVAAVNTLRHLADVWVLTAPSVRNPLSYTEKRLSIEAHFDLDFAHRLIISPDKSLLKGDVLIDDFTEGKGQDRFEGELIHFGSATYPDWSAVMAALVPRLTH